MLRGRAGGARFHRSPRRLSCASASSAIGFEIDDDIRIETCSRTEMLQHALYEAELTDSGMTPLTAAGWICASGRAGSAPLDARADQRRCCARLAASVLVSTAMGSTTMTALSDTGDVRPGSSRATHPTKRHRARGLVRERLTRQLRQRFGRPDRERPVGVQRRLRRDAVAQPNGKAARRQSQVVGDADAGQDDPEFERQRPAQDVRCAVAARSGRRLEQRQQIFADVDAQTRRCRTA